MKAVFATCLLTIACAMLYGQSKRHSADYYFEKGAKYIMMPDEKSDSLSKIAIAWYSKAINTDRAYWWAYRNRASLYGAWQHYDNAIADLNMAIRYCHTADKIWLYQSRGFIYYEAGEYAKSIHDLNLSIKNNGNPGFIYLDIAKCYWKLNKKDEACRYYMKAIKLEPAMVNEREFLNCN